MPTFFSIGFRPFFASGMLFAAIALAIWGMFWHSGANVLSPVGGMLFWHPHELLMGFAQAIIIGFLLTAARNWTGLETATPSVLCLLFACWWSARAIMAFGEGLPLFILIISQVITPLIAAVCIGAPIVKKRLWHNLFAPALLVLMALLDSSMLFKIQTEQVLPSDLFNIGILTVVLLMTMIGGRIIPLFTANRLSIAKPEESRLSLLLCVLPIILLMIMIAFGETMNQGSSGIASWPAQVVLAVLTAAHIHRLIRWHTIGIWQHPMLWSLFVFYAGIPAGFALLALNPQLQLGSVPWHMLTVGAMPGLILSMVTRVSLGHTGRVIVHDRIIVLAFVSLIVSTLLRTLGVAFFSLHPHIILSSAVLASFSMALIFARFIIIWLSPRPDAS